MLESSLQIDSDCCVIVTPLLFAWFAIMYKLLPVAFFFFFFFFRSLIKAFSNAEARSDFSRVQKYWLVILLFWVLPFFFCCFVLKMLPSWFLYHYCSRKMLCNLSTYFMGVHYNVKFSNTVFSPRQYQINVTRSFCLIFTFFFWSFSVFDYLKDEANCDFVLI